MRATRWSSRRPSIARVLEAIQRREGARAESLMREHARIAHGNLRAALADHRTWLQVPGASLIRRRPTR